MRVATVNVLRFASVLVGAGLLLRTASAENVVSAPQQEPNLQPRDAARTRLVLPKPAFGNAAPAAEARIEQLAAAPAKAKEPRVEIRPAPAKLAAAAPVKPKAVIAAEPAAAGELPAPSFAAAPRQVDNAAPAMAFTKPGLAARSTAPALQPVSFAVAPTPIAAKPAVATSGRASAPASASGRVSPAAVVAPMRAQPAAGLLAPVRIVSGTPVARKPEAAIAATTSAPAPRPATTAQPVQISLAPPVMRPGPRTTELTTDVKVAMRRAASSWDYAEALPPELMGRAAVAPRQTAAAAVAGPAARAVTAPGAAQLAAATNAAPASVAAAASAQAPGAPVAAAQVTGAPAPAKVVQGEAAPRPLALLDRPAQPAAVKAPALHSAAVSAASRPERVADRRSQASLAVRDAEPARRAAAPAPLAPAADLRRNRKTDDAVAANIEVSLQDADLPAETTLAAASGGDGSGLSLRDRVPLPAF